MRMYQWSLLIYVSYLGKQKRLKQAKEEAQDEIEKYRLERDRQFKEFEAKVSYEIHTHTHFVRPCRYEDM